MKRNVLFSFLFSILVTLAMNALDLIYHITTNTSVHLKYVVVKFLIIFVTIFLITLLQKINLRSGIFASILGPLAFWVYYLVAYPTIPRTTFIVDENLGYILIHAAALFTTYYLIYRVVYRDIMPEFSPKTPRRVWGVLLSLFGLVYTMVPYPVMERIGLGLELNQFVASLLGLLALTTGAFLLVGRVSHEPHLPVIGTSVFTALTVLTADLGALMLLKIDAVEDYGTVFFTNAPYVGSLLVLMITTLYLVRMFFDSRWTGKLLASLIVVGQIIIFTAATGVAPISVVHFGLLGATLFVMQYLVQKTGDMYALA